MHETAADGPRPTRRALLGGLAGVAGAAVGAVGAAPRAAADGPDLRVMTRNLYVGVDLFELAAAADAEDLRRIAGRLLAEARAHPYRARVAALADEVADAEPDALGVQEAALLRTREPSEFDGDHDPGAEDVLVDLLALLEAELAARGLEYEVAASVVTNDVEVPATTDDGDVDVRVTDRTALLVRDGLDVAATAADTFESAVPVPLADTKLTIERGFCRATLAAGGEPVTVATTHLEAFDPNVREQQAGELLERLPADGPVVVAGDVNSGPGGPSGAYDELTGPLEDALATAGGDARRYTCCFDADLRSDPGALSRRVDVVLYRGGLDPTDAAVVGADPDSRFRVETADGETVRLWPSDHAGVVAGFRLGVAADPTASPGTPTPTPTGTPTAADPATEERGSEAQSGFGALAGAGAAAVAALGHWLRWRRRR